MTLIDDDELRGMKMQGLFQGLLGLGGGLLAQGQGNPNGLMQGVGALNQSMDPRRIAAARQAKLAELQMNMQMQEAKRQQQTRDAYRTMVQGGPVSTGGAGGDQVAMQPGLLETANVSPMMRGLLNADPEKFAPLMGQNEMAVEAERRKLLAQRGEKLWEQQNIVIPGEQRKADQGRADAAYQNNLTLGRERALMNERFKLDATKPSDYGKRAQEAGFAPSTPEYQQFVRDATMKSGVNIDMAGEKEETKERAKMLVKEAGSVRDNANKAQAQIGNLRFAMAIPVRGGALEPYKVAAGAIAKSFGVTDETLSAMGIQNVANAQQYNGIMQNLVLTKMQAQAGPQTENDAKRIESTVASLRNDDEARQFLMKAAMALNERDVEKASFYEAHHAQKGTYSGAAEAWNNYTKDTPLFGFNPQSQRVVFYEDFMKAVQQANPKASQAEILDMWKQKYAGAR